ncbi:DUF5320 domain-containing protein [Desulfosoma caldarium]|uniref:DUF5320 domain-containing protein n=1 Tax=Desulfosoma caldarium TaxID=610254 RepID=A0A3N1UP13_9BACT|nr:DUF5320 domain-containing protein [Desulfosoma caldarium]ROQ89611.1 hypothetical protein EDC27_3148 [Desulfosoma caldarium]
MPGLDRTGPWGMGPRTGRGLGWCAGPAGAGPRTAAYGWGFGRGGRARGMRCGWGPWGALWRGPLGLGWGWFGARPLSREEELQWLKNEAASLEHALEQVRKTMASLEQEGQA